MFPSSGAFPVIPPVRGCCLTAKTVQTALAGTAGVGNFTQIVFDTVFYDTDNAADLANSQIKVPSWANWVMVQGHYSLPDQNSASGQASIHLWRNVMPDGVHASITAAGLPYYPSPVSGNHSTPEAHYHNRCNYLAAATPAALQYQAMVAVTPLIPVLAVNEIWTLYGNQNTGTSQNTVAGTDCWLSVNFYQ